MPLPEQQEYIYQISIIEKKILHLEETQKLEEKETQLMKNIQFHKDNYVPPPPIVEKNPSQGENDWSGNSIPLRKIITSLHTNIACMYAYFLFRGIETIEKPNED